MFPNSKQSVVLILGLTVLASLALHAGSRSQNDGLPSLETLRTAQYSRSVDEKQNAALGYSDIEVLINACQAYARGETALHNFHEPVLTRGDTGIAVFRRVSP